MKIGINAQILADAQTGVARYTQHMVQALLRCGSGHMFTVFSGARIQTAKNVSFEHVHTGAQVNSAWRRILWEQTELPKAIAKRSLDIAYFPDHTAPLFRKPSRIVITIHDLAFLALPGTAGVGRRVYKSLTIRRSVLAADHIVADSYATKEECLRYLRIPDAKITVVHAGIDSTLKRVRDKRKLSEVRRKYRLDSPFIVFVGTIESRKNIHRLVRAFALLKRSSRIPHALTFVGAPGHGFGAMLQEIRRQNLDGQVNIPGFVKDEDLAAIYSMADALIYPSLYEGFGFPPLEAMACECPVVTSNLSSLPETSKGASLLVNPLDEKEIAEAIEAIVTQPNLKKTLVAAGKKRIRQFTWDRAAKKLLTVFETLD